jgi:hypothetical protein
MVKVDGSSTAGHYLQISSSTGGDATDVGATYPSNSKDVIGRVQTASSGAGSFSVVDLFQGEVTGPSGSSSSGGSINKQTANYTIASGDCGNVIQMNGSSLTLQVASPPPSSTCLVLVQNLNASTLTISRNTLNINGSATGLSLTKFQSIQMFTDGTNWFSSPPPIAGTNMTITGAAAGSTFGPGDQWFAMVIPAANDVSGTAGGGWSADTACGTAPTLTKRNGTNISTAYWNFAASQNACGQLTIPTNWDSSTLPWVQVNFTQSTATGSQTIAYQIQIGCSTTSDDPSFQTAQAFSTTTTGTTINTPYWHTLNLNSTSMTSCAANQVMNWKLSTTGSSNGASNAQQLTFYWPYLSSTAPTSN